MDVLPPPSKAWGQNYLINKGIKEKIINALHISRNDIIIEIGAGRGALTELLSKTGNHIVAFEPHPPSFEFLTEKFKTAGNVSILCEDASVFDYAAEFNDGASYKIVGNLPYNVSVKIFSNLVINFPYEFSGVFMFQKEVARRISALPGSKEYGAVSVFASLCGESKVLFDVSPGSFFPVPKVYSSVISYNSSCGGYDWSVFKPLLQQIFSRRRKNISNILKSLFGKSEGLEILDLWGLAPTVRPERITPDDFKKLFGILKSRKT